MVYRWMFLMSEILKEISRLYSQSRRKDSRYEENNTTLPVWVDTRHLLVPRLVASVLIRLECPNC